jgi:hypothetical protein
VAAVDRLVKNRKERSKRRNNTQNNTKQGKPPKIQNKTNIKRIL